MAEVELTSVSSDDARRTPRVDFDALVELVAYDVGAQRVIVAQAFDLGSGGIGLAARERVSVGTHVTCRLTLDGRDTAFDGRVAWQRAHTSPRPHGLGVCFDPLGVQQRELLEHVVDSSQAGYRPVELRFGAVQTPVIARARSTPDGLRVSTPLPLLNRGTELAVRFEGEGHAVVGRITAVNVSEHDGTRRLEVDLALGEPSSVRFRRQARYADDDAPASAAGHDGQDMHDELTRTGSRAARPRRRALAAEARMAPASSPATTGAVAPSRGRFASTALAALRIAASLLLAAACGAGLSALLGRSWRAINAQPAPSVSANEPSPFSPFDHAAEHATAVPAAPALEPAAETQVSPSGESSPVLAEPAEPAEPAAPAEPIEPSAATTPAATATAVPAEPSLVLEAGVTVLSIPFTGSLDEMRTSTWASPAAVAIDLPHGQLRVAHGYYPLSGGHAAGLRVRQRNQESLVRVLLAQPVSRIAVTASGDRLEIRLTGAQ